MLSLGVADGRTMKPLLALSLACVAAIARADAGPVGTGEELRTELRYDAEVSLKREDNAGHIYSAGHGAGFVIGEAMGLAGDGVLCFPDGVLWHISCNSRWYNLMSRGKQRAIRRCISFFNVVLDATSLRHAITQQLLPLVVVGQKTNILSSTQLFHCPHGDAAHSAAATASFLVGSGMRAWCLFRRRTLSGRARAQTRQRAAEPGWRQRCGTCMHRRRAP